MTHKLQEMLREEAERLVVPPPPVNAILADGRRRRRADRRWAAVAVAASVAAIAGGIVGVTQLAEDGQRLSPAPADTPTSVPTAEPEPKTDGPLEVSGSGVGDQAFGTDAEDVVAAVTSRFGEPDLTIGPQEYFRVPGQDAWFERADDPLSPSWQHPFTSVTCWRTLCLVFGGEEADTLELRGWELAEQRRWSDFEKIEDPELPDVRLSGSGVGLGDSWEELHAAYPRTVVAGAEGATVAVKKTPWEGISDGAAAWRLSGSWDYARPTQASDDAVVTRLSGGDGPEPGCC